MICFKFQVPAKKPRGDVGSLQAVLPEEDSSKSPEEKSEETGWPVFKDGDKVLPTHLAPGRADYEQAFKGVNLSTEKISGSLFEISGTLAKTLATLKVSGTLFEASKNAQELFFKSVDPIL